MTKRRARIGDVIALELKHGFAYMQFAAKHQLLGNVCRVFPTIYRSPLDDLRLLERDWEAYRFATLVSIFLEDPRATWVGKLEVPSDYAETLAFRSAIDDDDWSVETRGVKTRVGALTDETARLPIAESVPTNVAIRRLEQGWLPEHDRRSWFTAMREAATQKAPGIKDALVGEYVDFVNARRAFDRLRPMRLPLSLFCGDGPTAFAVKVCGSPIDDAVQTEIEGVLNEFGADQIHRLHAVPEVKKSN